MRDFVYTNKSIEECYGCKACEQICPKNAITMSENEEGFQYPHIDTSKCVDCGLCQCVCPTQMENISVLFHVTPQTVSAGIPILASVWNQPPAACFFCWLANL